MRDVRLLVCAAALLASATAFVHPAAGLFSSLQAQQAFRGAIDLVPIYVTATDRRGALVPNLTVRDFAVRDEGKAQYIESFQATVQPITIAVLLDRSPSLFGEIERTQGAVREFVGRLALGDRATFGFFSHVVTLNPALTNDAETLLRRLGDDAPLPAGTALWDAIEAGRTALEREPGRRVILVITDAADNCSRSEIANVRRSLEREGVLLYGIGVRGKEGLLTAELESTARVTGGWYFELKQADDLAATMQRVADELHRQYLLAIPPRQLDGKLHRLQVSIVPDGISLSVDRGFTVRARRSYFASTHVDLH